MTDSNLLAGRYRMLERRDRAGTSWRSRDELLRRDVTISEIPLPPPGPSRDRLLDQVRAAAGLRHPGVTALHDVISGPGRLWLIMESVEGRSLLQSVRADGPLSSERAAEIGLRVLDALAAARELGVQLAATPDSVLFAPDGRVVLTGVAALGSAADELRDLGTTLFTAVEGRAPDTGSRAVLLTPDGTPLAEPTTGSTASGPLAPLVEELLSAGPGHRPDATSVRLTLERVALRPVPGVLDGHGTSPARRDPRRGLLLPAAAAAFAVLLLSATYWFWPRDTEPATGPAPVTLPTVFTRTPDPCALISAKQAAELALKTTPAKQKNECAWSTDDATNPPSLRYSLEISAFGFTSDEAARRNYARFLRETRARTRTDVGLPLTHVKPAEAVTGIGSEAFAGEVTNQLTYTSSVVFRAANLVISVQYWRGTAEDGDGSTSKGALKATRWILERLGREK